MSCCVNIFSVFQGNEAIRYLEFCVQSMSVKDAAIHNYLLSLYARLKPHELLTYLNFQGHVSLPVIMTSVLSMLFKKMYTCLSVSVFVNKSLCNIIHVKSAYDLFVVFI